jgi:putative sterol carrier protein
MEAKTPKEFFETSLPAKFNPEKAAGIDLTAQVKVTGPNGGDWTVTLKNQKLEVTQGVHPSPTVTIESLESDFLDVVNGKLSAEKAFFSGKIKLKGNIMAALKLRQAGFL